MPDISRPIAAVALVLLLATAPREALAQAEIPFEFVDLPVVGGLAEATNMCFLPDGRLLVVEQRTARVRLVVGGAFSASDPILTVPNVRSLGGEQGLLGVAVDPGWPARPYVYVYYDYLLTLNTRISRFTAIGDLAGTGSGDLTLDPDSRYDVLTTIPDNSSSHQGGTLRFGIDGMLYVSSGDDITACNAQRLESLNGKILRLDVSGLPDGAGGPPPVALIAAAGNPFAANPDSNARLVWAYGLRNPFSFHVDPLTGHLFVADVGDGEYEELDEVTTGGLNFGWPIYEGPGRTTWADCADADTAAGMTPPIYWHARSLEFPAAIIGGTVYRRPPNASTPFPAEYEGNVFVSDLYGWFLRRLKYNDTSWELAPAPGQPNPTDWAQTFVWSSDYEVGPDGALWYIRMWTNYPDPDGQIRRIVSTNPVSAGPVERDAGVSLAAPWPSPSRGAARISFELDRPRQLHLAIHDLAGRRVRTLVPGAMRGPGAQSEVWDGRADDGTALPAGVYLVRLVTDGTVRSRRLVWLR
jgi:glucose/arabinose dehydrogenase